jgi:hypothetical protein
MIRTKLTIVLVCCLAAAGATLLISAAIGSSSTSGPTSSGHQQSHTSHSRLSVATEHRHRIAPILLTTFRVLRAQRLRVAETGVSSPSPSTVAELTDALSGLASMGKSQGADPTWAPQTNVGPGGAPVWFVPGSSGACLVNREGSANDGAECNVAAAAATGELWTLDTIPYGTAGAMTQVLLGAAPDGNQTVTVNWSDGGSTSVPVSNNIYCVPIGSHPGWSSVTLKSSTGTIEQVAGVSKLPG